MKKQYVNVPLLPLAAVALLGAVPLLGGCDNEPDDLGDVIDDAGDALDDAGDEIGDAVEDAGDAVDDTVDEIDDATDGG
ncbi:MAG: hypothetical protein ACF8LK_01655 [Phycisphaerales bacterium JB041]